MSGRVTTIGRLRRVEADNAALMAYIYDIRKALDPDAPGRLMLSDLAPAVANLKARAEKAEAKLLTTKDGVLVGPRDLLWHPSWVCDGPYAGASRGKLYPLTIGQWDDADIPVSDCYSTREAAEAAGKNEAKL